MAVFVRFIKALGRIFQAFGTVLTVAITLGVMLVASFFTPLFSGAILFVLNQVALPDTAKLTDISSAIVVLGGGLTNDKHNNIVVNQYTKARLEQAVLLHHKTQLPIVVSGKEAPWMMAWLQRQNIWWVIPESNSFNTCENAKFTAKMLKINNVILITDPYHMSRARRQFALNQVATVAHPADLYQPTGWYEISQNLKHSRRAMYELMAFFRDVFAPQQDCKSKNY